ncbi:LPS-assembly protein LptD [Paenochrobactrum sp. BZR 588]|uniref:LPS-assembly protein LptD n=1 Tax=unclassified Paenochrobactrum TaxID=2639760 RepID=UPI003853DF1E
MSLSKARLILPNIFSQLVRGTAIACLLSIVPFAATTSPVLAQSSLEDGFKTNPDARMLLQADELVYDRDVQTVVAQGAVQIEYDGNRLVADKVTYNRQTNRMTASGNVQIVEKDGNTIYTDEIDVTDDFRDGFVNGLRVETTDDTRFVAESAERSGGEITTFNNGIYTACQACTKNPDKPVLWQIKARKIIWNGARKTVRFERGQFELFGMPIAFLPAFEIADPSVKRKSGFLFPGFAYRDKLGFGVKASYFWNLAPNYDLTVSTTGYTKQGFLTEAEWRHRLESGSYNLRIAGIHQLSSDKFNSNTTDANNTDRGMIASKGDFEINSRWKYGWDVMAQSDKNFSRTYSIEGYSAKTQTSKIYLTGLGERSYFDLNFYRFDVQEDLLSSNPREVSSKQPWVFPSLDHLYIAPDAVYGGEFSITNNLQILYRKNQYDNQSNKISFGADNYRVPGASGTNARFTSEAEWKRSFITPQGLVITPILALRGDAIGINSNSIDVTRSQAFRAMATAGMEVRWPILFSSTSSTHIIEPTAQIFVRNNEAYAGEMPNEDAQSFVFDATNLFERDKFSGYDRVEGGTRANLGLRYSGNLNNGWGVYGLAGQSFQLGGLNSFATHDFVNVGAESGLEHRSSDYVAMLGLSNSEGFNLAARGRFNRKDFSLERGEIEAQQSWSRLTIGARYAFIAAQPNYGYIDDRQELTMSASTKLNENWRMFGRGTYELVSSTLVRASAGLAYDDECFSYAMTYSQSRTPPSTNGLSQASKPSHSIGFNITFRTLGDFGGTSKMANGLL